MEARFEVVPLHTDKARSVARIILSGVNPRATINRDCTNTYRVEKGRGEFITDAGVRFEVKRGDEVTIPAGMGYQDKSLPDVELHMIATSEPPFDPEQSIEIESLFDRF